jgi:hypothetical protein
VFRPLGRPKPPYAAVEHEDLGFKHDPGKQAKYLEVPLRENEGRYREHLAVSVRAALK